MMWLTAPCIEREKKTMLVNDKEAAARLNSPLNLINKMKSISSSSSRSNAMGLFGIGKSKTQPSVDINTEKNEEVDEVIISFNPFSKKTLSTKSLQEKSPQENLPVKSEVTKLDDILDNNDSQIKLGLAHDNAIKLLNSSIDLLATKLDDIKADKLPSVINAASKTVESIRKERNEQTKNSKGNEVHYHFYTPKQNDISDYTVIDVGVANP